MAHKAQKVARKSFDADAGTIVFSWADGTQDVVEIADFTDRMRHKAMVHGFLQKLGDSYSGALTLSDAKARFADVLSQIQQGEWNRTRTTGGGSGGVWLEAIAQVTGQTLDAVRELWKSLTDDQRKAVKKDPRVKKAKLELEAARLAEEVADDQATDTDTDDLLGLFDA